MKPTITLISVLFLSCNGHSLSVKRVAQTNDTVYVITDQNGKLLATETESSSPVSIVTDTVAYVPSTGLNGRIPDDNLEGEK